MTYDTAGNPIIFYDQCAYCDMDTGGSHHPDCPCYEQPNCIYEGYQYWTEDDMKLLMRGGGILNE